MELFDFIKVFFTQPEQYALISDNVKNKHFFMVNRYFSIMYPTLSNYFNANGIVNQARIMDVYHERFGLNAKKVPGWFYTKSIKNDKPKEKGFSIKNQEALSKYLQLKRMSLKDFNEYIKHDDNGEFKETYLLFEKSFD